MPAHSHPARHQPRPSGPPRPQRPRPAQNRTDATVRQFSERIIEWDWPDAPPRNPVIAMDIPKKPEPLPKFLDDRDAARLMAAARTAADPRDRLVMELLARTGMRAGELAGPEADAVVLISAGHRLRIPLGKIRNDRDVPLHPELARLLAAWTADNLEHIRPLQARGRGPPRPPGPPRYRPHRPPVAHAAGVPGVHPHRLRHTLATQAMNPCSGWKPSPPCSAPRKWRVPARPHPSARPCPRPRPERPRKPIQKPHRGHWPAAHLTNITRIAIKNEQHWPPGSYLGGGRLADSGIP
jgi:Phage integrase family